MGIFNRNRADEEQPRLDGRGRQVDSSAWVVSFLVHLSFLILISLISTQAVKHLPDLVLTAPPASDPQIDELTQTEFHFDPEPLDVIGSSAMGGPVDDVSGELKTPDVPLLAGLEMDQQEIGTVELRQVIHAATGPEFNLNHSIKGAAGVGMTGADGAIDRITHEILMSLEERKTLVVWFFDQSGSLSSQREEVHRRFNRVYEELGTIEASGNEAFARHDAKPLLTSVVAFGEQIDFPFKKPTDDLDEIRNAVSDIKQDNSGMERVFTAIQTAVGRFKKYRERDPETRDPRRNVMFVVFSDEAGDDQTELDKTVNQCRRLAIPVYVVGVPAPFGRRETLMKWVDPDPKFDQSPQWGRVDQGPESLLPERVKIHFASQREDQVPIDSGFGPFALTRLCYETGGIYFTVHPNRNATKNVSRGQTSAYSAHIKRFFDDQTMRRYRPEYVSAKEYRRRVRQNGARAALLEAAERSWLTPMEEPRVRFLVRSEAAFAGELTEAQKGAAKLEPTVQAIYETLKRGESAREDETVPRWQAGYDLAMGRVLATKVRTETYNAMLAKAKRGLKFTDAKNNTWRLVPAEEITVGSQLKKQADKAHEYLTRVTQEHAGTPWSALAQRELDLPMSWSWQDSHTPVNPPRNAVAGNNNNQPRPATDEKRRMLKRPAPRRPLPKL
ncbi:MAG: VWA domain-containing protein [Pirellulaceae bacterium]|nr:VWA domain-containing protein [Pirellulaceae bacterium]